MFYEIEKGSVGEDWGKVGKAEVKTIEKHF